MNNDRKYWVDHTPRLEDLFQTRRQLLNRCGLGLGALGLATMLGETFAGTADTPGANVVSNPAHHPLAAKDPPLPARARHVVHIFAQGAPSQVDTWDPKPLLAQYDGKSIPASNGVAYASPFKFRKMGRSGIEVSEVFSRIGEHVDELAIIRSMYTDIPAHDLATIFMNTGSLRLARPSVGSWVLYGLGTENQNMPGFISLRAGNVPPGGASNWQAAFLPGVFQGVSINTQD